MSRIRKDERSHNTRQRRRLFGRCCCYITTFVFLEWFGSLPTTVVLASNRIRDNDTDVEGQGIQSDIIVSQSTISSNDLDNKHRQQWHQHRVLEILQHSAYNTEEDRQFHRKMQSAIDGTSNCQVLSNPPSDTCPAEGAAPLCNPYRSPAYCDSNRDFNALVTNRREYYRESSAQRRAMLDRNGYWYPMLEDKGAAAILASRYPSPTVYCCLTSPLELEDCIRNDVNPSSLPIVIKGALGHSDENVFIFPNGLALSNEGASSQPTSIELLTGRPMAFQDVESALWRTGDKVLVEEFVAGNSSGGGLPTEYKIHMFGRRPAAISIVANKGSQRDCACYAVVDGGWNRMDSFGCFERRPDTQNEDELVGPERCVRVDTDVGRTFAGPVKRNLALCNTVDSLRPPDCVLSDMLNIATGLAESIGVYSRIDLFLAADGKRVLVNEFSTNHMNGQRHCIATRSRTGNCFDACLMGRQWQSYSRGSPTPTPLSQLPTMMLHGGPSTRIPDPLLEGWYDLTPRAQCARVMQSQSAQSSIRSRCPTDFVPPPPTARPTTSPTPVPSGSPTPFPTPGPSESPTPVPTSTPKTSRPSSAPIPAINPAPPPTFQPATPRPSRSPQNVLQTAPTPVPSTARPSRAPVTILQPQPTQAPTPRPSRAVLRDPRPPPTSAATLPPATGAGSDDRELLTRAPVPPRTSSPRTSRPVPPTPSPVPQTRPPVPPPTPPRTRRPTLPPISSRTSPPVDPIPVRTRPPAPPTTRMTAPPSPGPTFGGRDNTPPVGPSEFVDPSPDCTFFSQGTRDCQLAANNKDLCNFFFNEIAVTTDGRFTAEYLFNSGLNPIMTTLEFAIYFVDNNGLVDLFFNQRPIPMINLERFVGFDSDLYPFLSLAIPPGTVRNYGGSLGIALRLGCNPDIIQFISVGSEIQVPNDPVAWGLAAGLTSINIEGIDYTFLNDLFDDLSGIIDKIASDFLRATLKALCKPIADILKGTNKALADKSKKSCKDKFKEEKKTCERLDKAKKKSCEKSVDALKKACEQDVDQWRRSSDDFVDEMRRACDDAFRDDRQLSEMHEFMSSKEILVDMYRDLSSSRRLESIDVTLSETTSAINGLLEEEERRLQSRKGDKSFSNIGIGCDFTTFRWSVESASIGTVNPDQTIVCPCVFPITTMYISEIVYGTKKKDYVELAFSPDINLREFDLEFYDGNDGGRRYGTVSIGERIVIDGNFGGLVYGRVKDLELVDPPNGDNSPGAAVALVNKFVQPVSVIQLLSYEGAFVVTDGSAKRMRTRNMSDENANSKMAFSLRQGQGCFVSDFRGYGVTKPSPGEPDDSQVVQCSWADRTMCTAENNAS